MKKKNLVLLPILGLLLLSIGCQNSEDNTNQILRKTLSDLEKIKSATYFSTENVYLYDDTTSISERKSFFKEYSNPTDTLVGCAFVKLNYNDTTKMDFLYNGIIRASVNWEEKHFQTDDFAKNPYPVRFIFPPFLTRAKTILKFALESTDSLSIKINHNENITLIRIEIYDEIIEFLGIIPNHESITEPYDKIISIYEIWFDKKTNLPFRITRNLPYNTIDETIENLKINQIKFDDFLASDYFPDDFDTPNFNDENPNEILTGTIAPHLYLTNIDNGNEINLKDKESKVTILIFTSIYCGACHNAIPFIQEISDEFNEKDLRLIIIETGNINPSTIQKYKTRNNINYNILLTNEETKNNYKVNIIPSFYILNQEKEIDKIINGFTINKSEILIRNAIKEII